MNNQINKNTITQSAPEFPINPLPGQAVQGSILFTISDFNNPPTSNANLIWKAMEDIIGVANMRLDYDEPANLYRLYKAKGHMDNAEEWHYEWEEIGNWAALNEEVAQALRDLKYVSYRYDTSVANTLTVYGIKKDMTEDLMVSINFISKDEADQIFSRLDHKIEDETARATQQEQLIISNLNAEVSRATAKETEIEGNLSNEITRATNRENELEQMIREATINPGQAIEVVGETNVVNVKVDNDSIKINNSNQLKADVFDDTQVRNDKGWSSAKISQEMTSAIHYKGQVADPGHLPSSTAQVGDMYNVVSTGDNYVWNGSSWDNMTGEYHGVNGIKVTGKNISLHLANNPGLVADSNGLRVSASDGLHTFTEAVGDPPIYYERVGINANFNKKTTPLGTDSSKLAIYSDGKIGVDFTESPVVLTAELLQTIQIPVGTNKINNVSLLGIEDYDMFMLEKVGISGSTISSVDSTIVIKKEGIDNFNTITMGNVTTESGTPRGLNASLWRLLGFNWDSKVISEISFWKTTSWLADGSNWNAENSVSTGIGGIRIYGIKAR